MFCKIFATIFALFGIASAGVLPAAYIAPYSFSHNEHVVNHAVAAPIAAPLAAPLAAAPYVAAPAYSAYPGAYSAYAAGPVLL